MSSSAQSSPSDRTDAWTIPVLCAGVALIACCMLIPAADENRKLMYERQKLQTDLTHIQQQVAVYDKFLKLVDTADPNMLEYLAQRQMKLVRTGTRVLKIGNEESSRDKSPFELVTLAPPPEPPPYTPAGGRFAALCREPRPQLFMMGAGMLMVAVGLVLGAAGGTDP